MSQLTDFAWGLVQPKKRESPSEWCEHNIMLVPPGGGSPFRIDFFRYPYQREILDCITEPGVQFVIVLGPTRDGKTNLIKLGMAYTTAHDPLPQMFIGSTTTKAWGWIRKEWWPLVFGNECLANKVPKNTRDHHTKTLMLYPGAPLSIFGANSDAQVSGETVARVWGDELGKWRMATVKEASILEQSKHRTESYPQDRFHLNSTTPTTTDSIEWTEFLSGDQCYWNGICPHCNTLQRIASSAEEFAKHVNWSHDPRTKNADNTWNIDIHLLQECCRYVCLNCGDMLTQDELWGMIRHPDSHWVASATPIPYHKSFLISGLLGPMEKNTMAALAVDYLRSATEGFLANRQDFYNSRLGVPWQDTFRNVSTAKLQELEKGYHRGALPHEAGKPDFLIVSADDQEWGHPFVVEAFCAETARCWTIDFGVSMTREDLEYIRAKYSHLARISLGIMDINYERHAQTNREFLYKHRNYWYGHEGHQWHGVDFVKVVPQNAFIGGKLEREGHHFFKVQASTYHFNLELETRLTDENMQSFPRMEPGCSKEEQMQKADFYRQLRGMVKRPRKHRKPGQPEYEFVSRGADHYWDCKRQSLALLWYLRRSQRLQKVQPPSIEVRVV